MLEEVVYCLHFRWIASFYHSKINQKKLEINLAKNNLFPPISFLMSKIKKSISSWHVQDIPMCLYSFTYTHKLLFGCCLGMRVIIIKN